MQELHYIILAIFAGLLILQFSGIEGMNSFKQNGTMPTNLRARTSLVLGRKRNPEDPNLRPTADAIGQQIQNESAALNSPPPGAYEPAGFNDWDPYRSDLAYGAVLQDPYIRADGDGVPQLYYNRHLTEKGLQDINYVPRRIRPPHGPVFWQNPQVSPSPLKAEFDENNLSMPERLILSRKLNSPGTFY